MKEIANSFAELAAIIMIMITLAVSTAAFAQWAGGDVEAATSAASHGQALVVAGARP